MVRLNATAGVRIPSTSFHHTCSPVSSHLTSSYSTTATPTRGHVVVQETQFPVQPYYGTLRLEGNIDYVVSPDLQVGITL